MIPSPWVAFVLLIAAFRISRFIGWDTFPPIVRARDWVTGARTVTRGTQAARTGMSGDKLEVDVEYRWEWLDELFRCAYCLGFWVSLAVYLGWVFAPTKTLYVAAVAALSGGVGIMARWLDP